MYDELVKRLRNNRHPNGLKSQAADAIEELQQIAGHYEETAKDYFKDVCYYLERVPKWIPVTERLPEEYVNVLCHLRSLDRQSEYYSIDHLMEDGQWWKAANSWKHEVTHWMPLPEPPDHIGDANEMVEPPKDGEA